MISSIGIFICGMFASAFGTMVGFGGGVFLLPILVVFFDIPIHLVVGSIALGIFSAAIISTFFNTKHKTIDYMMAIMFVIPTIMGTMAGSYLTAFLSVKKLEFLFGILLIIFSIRMISKLKKTDCLYNKKSVGGFNSFRYKISRKGLDYSYEVSLLSASLLGIFSGLLAGLFGIGGGFVTTPVMISILRIPAKIAVGTSLAMIIVTSFTSFLSHAYLGNFRWSIALPLLIGSSLGALGTSLLKKKISNQLTEILVIIALLLASASILLHVFIIS